MSSTRSRADITAPEGSWKRNITPSPTHFTASPRCRRELRCTLSENRVGRAAASSSPRSSVNRVYPERSTKLIAGRPRRERDACRFQRLLDVLDLVLGPGQLLLATVGSHD